MLKPQRKKGRKSDKRKKLCECVDMCDCVKCLYVFFPALVQGVIGGRPGRAILELCGLSLTVAPYYCCERTVVLRGIQTEI